MQKKNINIMNYMFYNHYVICFSKIDTGNNWRNLLKTFIFCILSFIWIFKIVFYK